MASDDRRTFAPSSFDRLDFARLQRSVVGRISVSVIRHRTRRPGAIRFAIAPYARRLCAGAIIRRFGLQSRTRRCRIPAVLSRGQNWPLRHACTPMERYDYPLFLLRYLGVLSRKCKTNKNKKPVMGKNLGEKPTSKAAAPRPQAKIDALYGDAAIKAAFNELGANPPNAKQDISAPPPKTLAQVMGEITWLMTQSPRHKMIQLGDLEWMVMAAILTQPVGVMFWADKRLAAAEWKSGTHKRIVDIVAPFGGEAEMREQVLA